MERLRFLHIPKTAGSTFTDILNRQYARKKRFNFTGDPDADEARFAALPESDRQNIALFTGHGPIVTGIDEANTATIITILRDPIERVKSFCQHVSEGKSPYLIREFPPERFSLDEFLESGNGELSNLEIRMLINRRDVSPLLMESMPASESAALALDNLYNRVAYFGIQEYFDESLVIFCSALNWKIPVILNFNKKDTGKQLKFEDRHLQRIEELNAISMELFKHAKARFMDLLNSDAFDEEKLKKLKQANNPFNRLALRIGRRIKSPFRI